MKNAIDFVKHAVTGKKFDGALTEIHFCGNCIQATNGKVTMHHPFEHNTKLQFSIDSTLIFNALDAVEYNVDCVKIEDDVVVMNDKRIKITLNHTEEYKALSLPDKAKYQEVDNLYTVVSSLMPFISDNSDNAWAHSIWVNEGYAYATNNVMVIRMQCNLPDGVIPLPLLHVINKLKKENAVVAISKKYVAIDYRDGSWIRSVNIENEWQDLSQLFTKKAFKKMPEITDTFADAVNSVLPFCHAEEVIEAKDNELRTEVCVVKDIHEPDFLVHNKVLFLVIKYFSHAKFKRYPKPMAIIDSNGMEGFFMGSA